MNRTKNGIKTRKMAKDMAGNMAKNSMRNLNTKSLLLFGAASFGLLALAGCATLSREQCLQGDWHQIGVSDGQQGRPFSRLDDHRSACRDTPVPVNEEGYRAGRNVGLQTYCTAASGYRRGSAGDRYANVCPAASEARFLQGYGLGQQIFRARQSLQQAENNVTRIDDRIDDKRNDIDDLLDEIADAGDNMDVSGPRRRIRELRSDIRELRNDRDHARYELDRARRNLEDVERNTSFQVQAFGG